MNAVYARQSVDKKDSLSIEGQVEQCIRLAGDDVQVYSDKGYSGKNIKRPAFTELMKAVEEGKIKKIFVYRLDRFSRSISDFSKIWELLEKNGVEFHSVTEHFDTSSPMGRAMLNIVLVFAQLERETTAERVKDNYIHRFRLGAWPGGPAPYGFDLAKIDVDGRKVSTLVENENAAVVKTIFEQYANPESSLRSIAKHLTYNQIHGPKRTAWDSVTLSRILHSPLYVKADGDVYWYYVSKGLQIEQDETAFDGIHACNVIGRRDRSKNKYNELDGQLLTVANHNGFVDSYLWLKVQNKLDNNKQLSRANAGKYSWLTGIMKCGKCGYSIKINKKNENNYSLLCSGKSNFSNCDAVINVDFKELEQYVENKIIDLLDNVEPQNIPQSIGVSEEILDIELKIERLVNAISQSSEIAVSYISRQIDVLHKKRDELLKQSVLISKKVDGIDFKKLSFEDKKIVVGEFIEKILLDDDNANIIWKF